MGSPCNQIAAIAYPLISFGFGLAGGVHGEGNAHYNVSNAFGATGDLTSAVEHMQLAKACYVRCFGADHSEVIDAQQLSEFRDGKVAEAKEAMRSADVDLQRNVQLRQDAARRQARAGKALTPSKPWHAPLRAAARAKVGVDNF